MNYSKLSKRDLINTIESIRQLLNEKSAVEAIPVKYNSNQLPIKYGGNSMDEVVAVSSQSDLEYLIGTIPFLLLNQEIFEKNQDIADFALKLNILIPTPEKKKREDIIGRVVSAIANFDNKNIAKLNVALKTIKKPTTKKDKSNFFKDWGDVIKEMNL